MLELIKKCLEKNKLKFWTINYKEIEREELYTIFNDIESHRIVKTFKYNISIFIDHDEYTGDSSFTILPNCSLKEIEEAIQKAISSAKLVKNQKYEIKQEKLTYPKFSYSKDSMKEFNDFVKELSKDLKVSSSEKFVEKTYNKFLNSVGNEYEHRIKDFTLDMVFLAGKNLESESQFLKNGSSIENLNLANVIKTYAKNAEDGLHAKLPRTGKYNVIFTDEALEEFFNFFLFHSSGQSFYNKYSLFKKDERVFNKGEGDELNIYSDPLIKGKEVISDSLGFLLNKFCIIENSILKNIINDVKYFQYLKEPFTGSLTNVIIEGGSTKFNDLIEENTLIITRVSAFEPKEITGDFSGEIRLAYLYKGKELIPIKGGSFTGNLREHMPNVKFSKEVLRYNSYSGPKGIKFFNVAIGGK